MRSFSLVICLVSVLHLSLATPQTRPIQNRAPVNGTEQPQFSNIPDPRTYGPSRDALDDLVGNAFVAGTTWYDFQHNGTAGKMIGVDDLGFVHIVWTNGLDSLSVARHTYYNLWDPATGQFTIFNGQVDASTRGGYVAGAMKPNGFYFPAYHEELQQNGTAHTAAAIDLMARSGAYAAIQPNYLYDGSAEMEIIWPKAAMDIQGRLHLVSTENPLSGAAGDPQRIYYSRGTPTFDGQFGTGINWDNVAGEHQFLELDTVMVISPDVACSRHTNRVVIAWNDSRDDLSDDPTQYNNDVKYIVSEDGGNNWSAPINVTNFIYPDLDCASGDTLVCDADTFRSYTDLSLLLDEDDDIHIAFTTVHYYSLEGTISRYSSQIWHWSSDSGYVSPIFAVDATYGDTNWAQDLGDWQYVLQRPNLAIDPETNELYCCFVLADDSNWSVNGIPMQDIWIAKSWNDGVAWTYGVNVTNTNTGQFVPVGSSAHERDATLAETVTSYGGERYLHMSYVFDRDAGGAVGNNPTGTPTLNPVHYQRINLEELEWDTVWNNQWPVLHVDSTGMPPEVLSGAEERPALPRQFTLHQNYPNPFNPSTTIQFDLVTAARVTLTVYNVLGETVATLINDAPLNAGVQLVNFDASGLSSGVYLYRLDADGFSQTRKMVLMK